MKSPSNVSVFLNVAGENSFSFSACSPSVRQRLLSNGEHVLFLPKISFPFGSKRTGWHFTINNRAGMRVPTWRRQLLRSIRWKKKWNFGAMLCPLLQSGENKQKASGRIFNIICSALWHTDHCSLYIALGSSFAFKLWLPQLGWKPQSCSYITNVYYCLF